ncbi:MAG: thiamine phosphate synthase [Cytophagaceae bacterium]|nr:thiamine phosphate synthase [Cytophagaceae bacterium]
MYAKRISNIHYITSDIQLLDSLLSSGLNWVQLRIKDANTSTVIKEAVNIVALCKQYGATCIINDYPEIVLEVGAHGVHLGLTDMKVADARKLLGDQAIIGGTCNTPLDILYQHEQGADYVGVGPYRFTETKKNLSPILGLEGYQRCVEFCQNNNIHIPMIAIGGIVPTDVPALVNLGLHGIAVSSVIRKNTQPLEVLEQFQSSFNLLNVK